MDFLADYQFAMRGERACNVWAVDYIRKMGMTGLEEMGASDENLRVLLDWISSWAAPCLPIDSGGLVRPEQAFSLPHARPVLPPVGVDANSVSFDPHSSGRLSRPSVRSASGLTTLSRECCCPPWAGAPRKFARAQCSADLARVACAPERYRLANGQFPDTLEALAPKFIEKLPYDVINGQPLKYRRTDDGQFVLYSVGLNETDDGGKVDLTKSGNADINKGDWVWRYPAK